MVFRLYKNEKLIEEFKCFSTLIFNMTTKTDLEKKVSGYQAPVLRLLDPAPFMGMPGTSKGIEAGQKLLEEIENSGLPEETKKYLCKGIKPITQFYRTLKRILEMPQV